MGYGSANAWSAAGEAAQNWARLLGQLYQGQQQQKQLDADRKLEGDRYNADVKYRGERDKLEDAHRGSMEGIANANSRREAIEGGWQPFSALGRALVGPIAGGIPGAAIPTPGMDPQALKAPSTEIGGEKMAYMPKPKPDDVNWQVVEHEGGIAQVHPRTGQKRSLGLRPKPAASPSLQVITPPTGDPFKFNPKTGVASTLTGPGGQPIQGKSDIASLPADLQRGVAQVVPTLAALDRFETASKGFLNRSTAERAAGKIGLSDADYDKQLGDVEAAQQSVLLGIKELAGLGVLAGADIETVTKLVGDPNSKEALIRDPQFVLTRINEARQLINDRVSSFEQSYGITIPRGAVAPQSGGRASGAGGPPPSNDLASRIRNDPSLSPQEKADLLRRIKR